MTPPRTRPQRIRQSSLGIPTDKEEFFQVQERYRKDDEDENDPWQNWVWMHSSQVVIRLKEMGYLVARQRAMGARSTSDYWQLMIKIIHYAKHR
eukprot:scaffold248380_cov51-Cyclotella_meneghiniana.AAC.6